MRDVAPSTGRPTLDKPRSRRDAAKVLAVALQTRYRKLLSATGEDETVIATADLAQCMYENIEFVLWALKHVGGMNPPPPEELRKVTAPNPAGNRYAKPPAFELDERDGLSTLPCTCPPLEAGIIGRTRHMTSCPKFIP
jgi:hypothetical protein